ncbi:ATP-binding protein [Actinoplanes sp. NPDC051513]|uniref:ATP-binding protein n=1 Tax=Actinoplanes sp. NPDC051513 TaxID=3363908 RepID=UPI0037A8F428
MNAEGRVAKVRLVEPEIYRVWLDFQGGATGYFESGDCESYSIGDVLFCVDGEPAEKVSANLWSTGSDVGTVRLVAEDSAVVEIDGKLRSFRQRPNLPFEIGQTIEMDSSGNPGKLLSAKPVDRLGLLDRNEFDIESLIYEPSDTTTLDDFGGSTKMVKRARDLVTVALDPANRIKAIGANPIKGMLFSGPSGTGKTFLAKALASATQARFYNISGPAIIDQFVGQSERTLRSIFEHAQSHAPAVLFFDEIDSLYTQRGAANHEATNRLVGQFLSLLDGFTAYEQVIVIATTNLAGSLDEALLRPGRLSHKLEFSLPDATNRSAILAASARRLKFSEQPNFSELAAGTDGWTAADLSAIWTEAAVLAALDGRNSLCLEDVNEAVTRVQRIPTLKKTGQE